MSPKIVFKEKVETRFGLVIFVLIFTIIASGLLLFTTYGLITVPYRIGELSFFWLGNLLFVLLGCNYISWQLRGVEVLSFKEAFLEIRLLGVLSGSEILNCSEIENITYDDGDTVSYTKRFWGVGGGKVIIECRGRFIRFGQDISLAQAKSLSETLLNEVKKRTSTNVVK